MKPLLALSIIIAVAWCICALGSKLSQAEAEDETERWTRLQNEMGLKPADPEDPHASL